MGEMASQPEMQHPYDYTAVFKAGLEASVAGGFMSREEADDMLEGWLEEQGDDHERR